MNIDHLRREYASARLEREDLDPDPLRQFAVWFEHARAADLLEPNAMTVATVDEGGQPRLRNVLLKYFDERGFVFFTNYGSVKAHQIAANPRVALLFSWLGLERQVSVDGRAERVPTHESLRYFLSRPKGSQLGAWVSRQSAIIGSRQILELKFEEMKRRFADGEVPLPTFWGGFRVCPQRIEFWQGRPNRLHDRFQYTLAAPGEWTIERLAP